ncbi:hypothetical protein BVX98_02195 [bacterium F11]|nr:hypothetical protein BVX98_02195 [bacterium F11]
MKKYILIFILSSIVFGYWAGSSLIHEYEQGKIFAVLGGSLFGTLFGLSNCSLMVVHSKLKLNGRIPYMILFWLILFMGLPWGLGITWQLMHEGKMAFDKLLIVGVAGALAFGCIYYAFELLGWRLKKKEGVSLKSLFLTLGIPFGFYVGILFGMDFGPSVGILFGIFGCLIFYLIFVLAIYVCKLADKPKSPSSAT